MGLVGIFCHKLMVEQSVRLMTLVQDKKSVLTMAYNSGMIPSTQPLEIMELIPMEHYISEQIMKQLWEYYKERPNLGFTDGMETRMILKSVTFAGMFAAYEYTDSIIPVDAETIVYKLARPNMGEVIVNVQKRLGMGAAEGVFLFSRIEKISERLFNTIFEKYQVRTAFGYNADNHLLVFKDTMTILFCLGMIYAIHRMEGRIGTITESRAWEKFEL